MSKRFSGRGPGRTRERGRIERVLFSFMGPPQLGDPNEPVRQREDRPAELCPRCGQPYEDHQVVRTARGSYTRCE
jgi:hypothetical protein